MMTLAPTDANEAAVFADSDDLGQLVEAHDFAMMLGRSTATMPEVFARCRLLAEAFSAGRQLAAVPVAA